MTTLVDPGVHGADVAGTQGCGVSTPAAAAVAAATCGFSGDLHIPNDAMFVIGKVSCTVAAGVVRPKDVPRAGSTVNEDGVDPIEQMSVAP
jgi:hypothetical protein